MNIPPPPFPLQVGGWGGGFFYIFITFVKLLLPLENLLDPPQRPRVVNYFNNITLKSAAKPMEDTAGTVTYAMPLLTSLNHGTPYKKLVERNVNKSENLS